MSINVFQPSLGQEELNAVEAVFESCSMWMQVTGMDRATRSLKNP